MRSRFVIAALLSVGGLFGVAVQAQAQTDRKSAPVDAGTSLDVLRVAPVPSPTGRVIEIPPNSPSAILPGGQRVTLKSLSIKGLISVSEATVIDEIGDSIFLRSLDLSELRSISDAVSQYLRGRGLPFARAFLPPQNLADGNLIVEVYEGTYGQATASSANAKVAEAAQKFINFLPGRVIAAPLLERVTLLVDDLPGVSVSPVIRPGVNLGEGDLQIDVTLSEPYSGSVSIDNHGSRYSGERRVQAQAAFNSVQVGGDQVSVTAMVSNEDLRLGSLSYSVPIGGDGLRAQVSYSSVSYQLAGKFEGFEGTARVKSIGASYPVLRSRQANVTASLTYQHKRLEDQFPLGSVDRKAARVTPLVISFDRRDDFGAGGVTYGALTGSHGSIQSETFTRWNLDTSRLQVIDSRWTLLGRLVAQRANKDLDSSEGLSLGGAQGVRAYPNGEGGGDEGWLIQAEARANLGSISPYVFYDQGWVRVDTTKTEAPNIERSGLGVGIRFNIAALAVDTAVAWRVSGAPKSDTERDPRPRVWLSARYSF